MASPTPPLALSPPTSASHPPPVNWNAQVPPEKRQKLSHGPSPLGTSPINHAYPPHPPQWSPYTPQPQSSMSYFPANPLQTFNTPQPPQTPTGDQTPRSGPPNGTMGPPERPQKPIDPNDINDMVALSGVDLRAEDEYLQQSYIRPSHNTSFETQRSSTASPNNSFGQWSQGNHGSQPAFSFHAPFSQPAVNEKSLEEVLQEKHKRAARAYSERKQHHLADPFLATNVVRERLHRRCWEEHTTLDSTGVREEPNPTGSIPRPDDVKALTNGTNGNGLVMAKVRRRVDVDSPTVEVLALLSLACNERLRSLMEDAFAVSRARRTGSQGVVPPEWSSIAQGSGPAETAMATNQSITNTSWDKIPDTATSQARAVSNPAAPSTGRLLTPPTEPSPQPQPTVAYKSSVPSLLQSIAQADREAEKKRLDRRRKRQKDQQASTVTETDSPSASIDAPATPGTDVAPNNNAPKLSKKQLAAEKKSTLNEDAARRAANATASMILGRGKKYSWLSGGGAKAAGGLVAGAGMGRGVGNAPKVGSTPGTPGGPLDATRPAQSAEDPGLKSKDLWQRLGEWREDGDLGKGIQIRDLISVMERDGLERKSLAKCYTKLKND